MATPTIAVVTPSNRPECLAKWWNAWAPEFTRPDVKVYVVWDDEETYAEIDKALGERSWIIPRRTDCIRSWGYLKAYWDGADYIVTLDDDCLPSPSDGRFLEGHLAGLGDTQGWVKTITGLPTRGVPKDTAHLSSVINHGLWRNIPDLSGETQLAYPPPYRYVLEDQLIPAGKFFAMSGMNLAWARAATPFMWFGLQGCDPKGERWGYDRFGDIWCGLLAKRVCDHLQYTIHSGFPAVWHDRASDPQKNVELEKAGARVNEWLWRSVAHTQLTGPTPASAYRELSHVLQLPDTHYWWQFRNGMRTWIDLVKHGA